MPDIEEVLKALKCSIKTSANLAKCENCRYRVLEKINGIPVAPDLIIDGVEYWQSCDNDRMIADAIKVIEEGKKNDKR